jgi:hypothetical protein
MKSWSFGNFPGSNQDRADQAGMLPRTPFHGSFGSIVERRCQERRTAFEHNPNCFLGSLLDFISYPSRSENDYFRPRIIGCHLGPTGEKPQIEYAA